MAAAETGIAVSDGSTNVLPVGDTAAVRAAWQLHADLVRRSLERGFYQGWDLHPAQLASRYAATFRFFTDGLAAARARLAAYAAAAGDRHRRRAGHRPGADGLPGARGGLRGDPEQPQIGRTRTGGRDRTGARRLTVGLPGGIGAVSEIPLCRLLRGDRAGARHGSADPGAVGRPDQPRVPVLRPPRLRQDLQRPDPGPVAELRAGPDADPVRGVLLLRGAGAQRPRLDRRDRDRRGQPRRRRGRPRPARAGLLRAGARPLQGLHHRRGPHGHHPGLQRAAEAGRGAAGLPGLHLRHHRAGQGAADDPVAHPPLPVPADPAVGAAGAPGADLRRRGGDGRAGGVPAGGAGRRRLRPGLAVGAGPAAVRRRARRASPTPGRSGCSASPTPPCSTT